MMLIMMNVAQTINIELNYSKFVPDIDFHPVATDEPVSLTIGQPLALN